MTLSPGWRRGAIWQNIRSGRKVIIVMPFGGNGIRMTVCSYPDMKRERQTWGDDFHSYRENPRTGEPYRSGWVWIGNDPAALDEAPEAEQ